MAETATRQQTDSDPRAGHLPRLREAPVASAGGLLAVVLGCYLTAVALSSGAQPVLDPDAPFGLQVSFRMNLVISVIVAYTVAVGLHELRTGPRDLARLRALLDCDDDDFGAAVAAFFPSPLQAALALTAGGGAGVTLAWVTSGLIERTGLFYTWGLHEVWNVVLVIVLFALLALFALWGIRSAALYSWLSRRYARVRLLDPSPFQIFASRGLRLALFWFIGSGIALLLLAGAQAPETIVVPIVLTSAIGIACLILPSLGIHQRMREVKAEELERVRGEIEKRLGALRAGYSDGAAELPALLAWEARVDQAPEWPLGGGVLFRFGLLVLIPLGSWLGGALVERMVDSALG